MEAQTWALGQLRRRRCVRQRSQGQVSGLNHRKSITKSLLSFIWIGFWICDMRDKRWLGALEVTPCHGASFMAPCQQGYASPTMISYSLVLPCFTLRSDMLTLSPPFRPVKKRGGTAAGVPRSMGEAHSSATNGLNKDQVRGKYLSFRAWEAGTIVFMLLE